MDEPVNTIAEDGDWKKARDERNAKIKKLYKENPDNEIIKEMNDEIEQEEQRMERKGPSPFSYIHEAVWAAERAYNDGTSYRKCCNDLIESIDAFSKIVDDKPRKESTKESDYE